MAALAALSLITTVAGQNPAPLTADGYFAVAENLVKEKKYTEALTALRNSESLDPSRPETQANIGSVLMALRRPAEAIPAYREAIKLDPTDGTFRMALCQALSLTKNHSEAITACEEGVRLAPDSAEAQAALVSAMSLARRPQSDILRILDFALAKFRENEILLQQAASYHAEKGNLPYAAELYERLTRIKPSSALYHARLADVYLRLDRDDDALASARRSLQLEPDNPFAHYFMGRLFFELGQHAESAAAFQKVVNSGVELPEAEYYYALSESRRGRNVIAIDTLRRLTVRFPENFNYFSELGNSLNQNAQYEDAVSPLRSAVALDPKNFEAKAALGLALFESARFEDGISVLEEANRIQPGNQVVTMFLNVARSRQQRIPQIDEMKQYASENPQDLNVRLNLIQFLAYSRRIGEAELYVEEVWKMNPTDVRVYHLIATSYSTAGQYDKALAAHRRSLEIKEDPTAYLGFASIYARRGQADEASQAYAKVIELKPDSPNIMKLYADHLRDNGKRREALEMYKRSLSMLPLNGPALFNAGILSFKLGEVDAARQYAETLKTADPKLAKTLERCMRLKIWN